MKTSHYREKVIAYLGDYKKNFLGVIVAGTYRKSTKDYEHILINENNNKIPTLNFLPTIDITNTMLQNIKYHEYANHLNSSQVMCINFFLPLIEDKNLLLNILTSATGIEFNSEAKIKNIAFEKTFSKTDNTNFDFYIELSTGEKLYFEIKYTEQNFGGNCFEKGNLREKYEDKYNNYYENYLKDSLMGIKYKEEFFKNYQINRNLSYIKTNKDFVFFILPIESDDLLNEVKCVLDKNKSISNQAKVIGWENLCDIALKESENTKIYQHFKLFKEKYIV